MAALAIAAIAVGVLGTAVSINANKNAAEDQQKVQAASNFENRQTSLRKRIREQRILEGRIRNAAIQQGSGGSSGEAGAISSMSSQFATGSSADAFSQAASARLGQIESNRQSGMATGSLISAAGGVMGAYASYKNTVPAPEVTPKPIG